MTENISNNIVTLIGTIKSDLEFNHKVFGEGFYKFIIEVKRLSDSFDEIPVTVSERVFNNLNLKKGDYIQVAGQFRSYNNYNSQGNRLILTVFAQKVTLYDNAQRSKNPNSIILSGYICKTPIFRTTPFGREITDLLLAVNRAYNKSDYIPCIAWGRNAIFSGTLAVGDNVKIWGRIQSREYQKRLPQGEIIVKTAYEVSVSKLELVQNAARD